MVYILTQASSDYYGLELSLRMRILINKLTLPIIKEPMIPRFYAL